MALVLSYHAIARGGRFGVVRWQAPSQRACNCHPRFGRKVPARPHWKLCLRASCRGRTRNKAPCMRNCQGSCNERNQPDFGHDLASSRLEAAKPMRLMTSPQRPTASRPQRRTRQCSLLCFPKEPRPLPTTPARRQSSGQPIAAATCYGCSQACFPTTTAPGVEISLHTNCYFRGAQRRRSLWRSGQRTNPEKLSLGFRRDLVPASRS